MTIKRCYPVLVGASVAENQLVSVARLSTNTSHDVTLTNNNDGSVTINGTCTGRGSLIIVSVTATAGDLKQNHVYYLRGLPSTGVTGSAYCGVAGLVVDRGNGGLFKMTYDFTASQMRIDIYEGDTFTNATVYPQYIDLTAMFGSTIADHIYSLEQATAGSGIAWLRSYDLITDDYKPYNAGTIESVEATAKVVRDENGENAVTYSLGSDTLRGIFKLDASNKLYADGDRKEADGTITRQYKMIDLGTLPFNDSNPASHIFRSELNDAKMASDVQSQQNAPVNALMSNGYQVMGFTPISSANDKCFSIGFRANGDKRLVIIAHDYDSVSAFTQAMSGIYLVYELETPTTEQGDPFTSPQIVYPDGTEEFVTENGVPVGHESKYQL